MVPIKQYQLKSIWWNTSTWLGICSFAVHKEHEMEIGYPTDVKHVAHIGLGTSDTSPSWVRISWQYAALCFIVMSEFTLFIFSFNWWWCTFFFLLLDGWIQGNRWFINRLCEHSCAVKADFLGLCRWFSPLTLFALKKNSLKTKKNKTD